MKKYVSTLLVFALMFVFSTSAFAEKGFADTKEDAVELKENNKWGGFEWEAGYLDYQDSDFYKFTNKTGETIVIDCVLHSDGSHFNYDLRGHFPNGDIITAKDGGPDNKDVLRDIELRPGETIYFEVVGHTARDFGRGTWYRIYL